jgi:hypothetical protein
MSSVAQDLPIGRSNGSSLALKYLNSAARLWFLLVLAGQLLFVAHIVSFYGRAALAGDLVRWNKPLTVGYVAGDGLGNAALSVHLAMAAMISFAGLLQLIPQIRARFPTFHRWNGRAYIVMAFLASGSALYLQLVRGGLPGGFVQHIGLVLNAVLIMIFALLALRYALARRFDVHRRWALRLFMVVSGVWFFRVGLFFWIIVNHGPVGFDSDKFEGPALTVLSFLQYLLPLAVLELYLRAQRGTTGVTARFAAASVLLVLTVAMGIGLFGHTAFMFSSGVGF